MTEEKKDKIEMLYNEGLKPYKVSNILHITTVEVKQVLRERGYDVDFVGGWGGAAWVGGTIAQYIKAHPNETIEQVAVAQGVLPSAVKLVIKKLQNKEKNDRKRNNKLAGDPGQDEDRASKAWERDIEDAEHNQEGED